MELTKLLHYYFTLLRYKQMLSLPISRHFAKTMFLSCLLFFIFQHNIILNKLINEIMKKI